MLDQLARAGRHRQPDTAHRPFARLLRPARVHRDRVRRREKAPVDQHRRPAVAQQQRSDDPDAWHALQRLAPDDDLMAWSYRPRATMRRSASPPASAGTGGIVAGGAARAAAIVQVRRAALVQPAELPDAEAGEAGRGQEQQGHHEAASGR